MMNALLGELSYERCKQGGFNAFSCIVSNQVSQYAHPIIGTIGCIAAIGISYYFYNKTVTDNKESSYPNIRGYSVIKQSEEAAKLHPNISERSTCYLPNRPDPYECLFKDVKKSPIERVEYLKQVPVFSPGELSKIRDTIREVEVAEASPFDGGKRRFYLQSSTMSSPVRFDEFGNIDGVFLKAQKGSLYNQLSESVQEIAFRAISCMAKELQWGNCEVDIAFSAIEYHFGKGAKAPLAWHEDDMFRNGAALYSMVVLLSDPKDPDSGWTGGDLLYTKSRDISPFMISSTILKKHHKESSKGEEDNDPNSPIWSITPVKGEGALFGNQGMRHYVTHFVPNGNEGSRMIFNVWCRNLR